MPHVTDSPGKHWIGSQETSLVMWIARVSTFLLSCLTPLTLFLQWQKYRREMLSGPIYYEGSTSCCNKQTSKCNGSNKVGFFLEFQVCNSALSYHLGLLPSCFSSRVLEALSSCTWLNLSCCQDLVSVGNRVEEAGCSLELAHRVCSDSTGENLITYTVSVAILEATKCNTAGQAAVLLI